jgi:ATP-binding cassette, subfamily B, bacterial MsbA
MHPEASTLPMSLPNLIGANPKLAALLRRHLWTAAIVAVLAVVIGLLEGLGLSLLIPVLSILSGPSGQMPSRGFVGFILRIGNGSNPDRRLLLGLSVIFLTIVLKAALQAAANTFTAWVDGRIGHEIRCGLSRRLEDMGYPFFLLEQPSRLVNIITTDSWKASEAVKILLVGIAAGAAVAVFSLVLFLVNWRLSLVVLAGGLGARLVQKRFTAVLRQLSRRTVSANELLADRMIFAIFGARLIRIFSEQRAEQARFDDSSERVRRAMLRGERLSGIQGPVLEAIHGFLFLIIVTIAWVTHVALPVIVTFLVLMNRLQPHLRLLEQSGATFALAAGHFDEVEWLLEPKGKPRPPLGEGRFSGLSDRIEFDDVSFDYGMRGDPALRKVSFVLRRGRSVALMGGSGSGKSTIINLLCRLLEPTEGTIRVDGRPLSQIDVSDWLNSIGVAGQDVDLIDGTIGENVKYGRPSLDFSMVELALRSARANFVFDLPQGIDTLVGPRGVSLSGGQRQRISIARALARSPQILILDEATNAVDQETENDLVEIFRDLAKSMTVVVISHRPSTIAFCEDAIVLGHGVVLESGPLSSTLAYRQMQMGAGHSVSTEPSSNQIAPSIGDIATFGRS